MNQSNYENAIEYLKTSIIAERNPQFREAIQCLDYRYLKLDDINIIVKLYSQLKDIALRKKILQCLYYTGDYELKQFYLAAYKKERYLDMKLDAVRGYANYASEIEVDTIMANFIQILIKRPESTPYNYQEYEYLRSACGLQYLIKKYGYFCFENTYNQVEKQYNDMPDAFKGHFTYDIDGKFIELRNLDVTKKMMDDFFNKRR